MTKTTCIRLASAIFFGFYFQIAWSQTNVGTFVASKGDVKILRDATAATDGSFLIYEGKKYAFEEAKIGKKVRAEEIIQCGANGKAKVVYANGDHFVVAPGTSMVVPGSADQKTASGAPTLKIFYGKVRSLVTKGGPQEKLKVTTPTAVAGVRGTDFFVRHNPVDGTQLTVVRGEVIVQSKVQDAKPIAVKKGYMVRADAKGKTEVKEATKEELVQIQVASTVAADAKAVSSLPQEVKTEIKQLNEKTKDAVLADIKKDDPKLFEELKTRDDLNAATVHTVAVATLYQAAPSDAKKKPSREEIQGIGKDVYEKYFDPTDVDGH